ncbi:hypothetical protein [Pseudomonas sp. MWU318]|uniref:hypothetical protein n=1 Tax=Pseudomonas sp. MWU318 TaxID=2802569 RepID=UPI0019275620|nr:hypothetical protein [Pseudomonas sp. MWU318]
MTIQEKIGKAAKLTQQEIAERSRTALRSSTLNLGRLAEQPIIVGKIVDNLIPKAILDPGPMIVRFDTTTIMNPHADDAWALYQRKGESGSMDLIKEDYFGPVAGRPQFLDVEVTTTALVDDDLIKGSTNYQYQFFHFKGEDGNPDRLPWVHAEIDRIAPEQDKATGRKFQPEQALFTNLPARGTIDDKWLAENEFLTFTVNRNYEWYRPDDRIFVYINQNYGTGTSIYNQVLSSDTVSIPRDLLPKLDSSYYLWYELADVVGNLSAAAFSSLFKVQRRPPPSLLDCVIPKGISPDVVDLKDLEGPVYLNVPYTINGQENDRIIPRVGSIKFSTGLGNQPLGADTTRTLQFPISISRLLAMWDNATAPVPIVANYNFSRGVEPLVPSTDTNSALDFTYRGPVNPVFPELENPDMTKVTVLGQSATPNHITADDRGKDVDISTPMITPPTTWVPLGDETAKLWFNGVAVHSELLSAGAVAPLTYTMDSALIDAAAPETYAWWTIEETGGRNVMKSPDQKVTIENVRINLPQPTVRLFNGFVSCRYLTIPDFELPVTVPIDPTHMPTGTVVTLKSVGTKDALGQEVISGTEYSDTYTIIGSETGGVFVKNIKPYREKLKPIQPPAGSGLPRGYIKIWYEVRILGVVTPSAHFLNEVSLLNDSNQYCEGTPTS